MIYGFPLLEMGLNGQEILLDLEGSGFLGNSLANPLVVTCKNWMNLAKNTPG